MPNQTYTDYPISEYADILDAVNTAISDRADKVELTTGSWTATTTRSISNSANITGVGKHRPKISIEPGDGSTGITVTGSNVNISRLQFMTNGTCGQLINFDGTGCWQTTLKHVNAFGGFAGFVTYSNAAFNSEINDCRSVGSDSGITQVDLLGGGPCISVKNT